MRERNELMHEGISFVGLGLHDILTLAYWRNVLRGTDTEFPEYDYLTPLGEEWYTSLYGHRRRFDASTQTDDADADTTLMEIDTPDSKSRSYAQVVWTILRLPITQTKDADMTLAGNDPLASDPSYALRLRLP
ncbi:hypothetical protein EDB92DRAFT_1820112 [Lactarius akahatsu]|uniref:Uncharacterized protein n=1 Tax=Lactarius akahatsu TaxID=416441 RepID=A0AAD4L8S7_9AGAM|nr:hypothetical protein EDB92DRAFT_1820112 [Lactarius akahatsu]